MRLLFAVEQLAWSFQSGDFVDDVSKAPPFQHLLLLLIAGCLVPVTGIVIEGLFGRRGEVDSAIWFRSGRTPLLSTVAGAVESIVIVGLGASLGRESAIKQVGGAIASWLASVCGLSRGEQRVIVACGVGAGMAAAYNVPVGGALFAVEVLLGSVSLRLVLPALVCSVIATASSWTLLPVGPVYDVPEYPLSIQLTVWAVCVGPLIGLAAIPFVRALEWAENCQARIRYGRFIAPILTFTALGALSIPFPELLGNGQEVVQRAFIAQISVRLLATLTVLKFVATFSCLASGAHGGLFTPTLAIGALLGGTLGYLWEQIWPGASLGCCSVIGASAFLAAASLGPVSALILVLELTRHVDATMVPMLLAVAGAMGIARYFNMESIYSVRIYSKKPIPTAIPLEQIAFGSLISTDAQVLSASVGYPRILQMLTSSGAELPIQVTDHQGIYVGTISSDSLRIARHGPLPLECIKAADIVVQATMLNSQMSLADVIATLLNSNERHLPVIETTTQRLIGVVKRESCIPSEPNHTSQRST